MNSLMRPSLSQTAYGIMILWTLSLALPLRTAANYSCGVAPSTLSSSLSTLTIGVSELVVNNTAGNVGIGTSNAHAVLTIQGSTPDKTTAALLIEKGSSPLFQVLDDGTVTFGSSLPTDTTQTTLVGKTTRAGNLTVAGASTLDDLYAPTSTLWFAGSLGVRTLPSPDVALRVAEPISIYKTGSPIPALIVSDGKIGMGVDTPTTALTMGGSIQLAGGQTFILPFPSNSRPACTIANGNANTLALSPTTGKICVCKITFVNIFNYGGDWITTDGTGIGGCE